MSWRVDLCVAVCLLRWLSQWDSLPPATRGKEERKCPVQKWLFSAGQILTQVICGSVLGGAARHEGRGKEEEEAGGGCWPLLDCKLSLWHDRLCLGMQ